MRSGSSPRCPAVAVAGRRVARARSRRLSLREPPGWRWPPRFVSVATLRESRGQGVIEIPNGVVFGSRGHLGVDTDSLLVDGCTLWDGHERTARVDATEALAIGMEPLEGVTVCAWANGQNYAHCLLQSVPRLELFRRAGWLDADRFLVTRGSGRPWRPSRCSGSRQPASRSCPGVRRRTGASDCGPRRRSTCSTSASDGPPSSSTRCSCLNHPGDVGRRLYVGRGAAKRRCSTRTRCGDARTAGIRGRVDGRSLDQRAGRDVRECLGHRGNARRRARQPRVSPRRGPRSSSSWAPTPPASSTRPRVASRPRLPDAHGDRTGAAAAVVDMAGRRRHQGRPAALQDASTASSVLAASVTGEAPRLLNRRGRSLPDDVARSAAHARAHAAPPSPPRSGRDLRTLGILEVLAARGRRSCSGSPAAADARTCRRLAPCRAT